MICDVSSFFNIKEIGEREGKFYAINVPLRDGIDDSSFNRLFRAVSSLNPEKQIRIMLPMYLCVLIFFIFFGR